MAQTTDLLTFVDEFPAAFVDSESQDALTAGSTAVSHTPADPTGRTQQLLKLMDEFASAFADPEASIAPSPASTVEEAPTETVAAPAAAVTDVAEHQLIVPENHTQALHRQLKTISWGQVDVFLSYGEGHLQSIWIAVGKSGTEVQSLCEAIARLTNLLLARQVPIPEITREIRGIRGADSEGFGPNRVLGLADLIGKVLQEAPVHLEVSRQREASSEVDPVPDKAVSPAGVAPKADVESTTTPVHSEQGVSDAYTWSSIPEDSQAASLCPECGAELQVMNGCSGGACNVCGYSSCS